MIKLTDVILVVLLVLSVGGFTYLVYNNIYKENLYSEIIIPILLSLIVSILIYIITSLIPEVRRNIKAKNVLRLNIKKALELLEEYIGVSGIIVDNHIYGNNEKFYKIINDDKKERVANASMFNDHNYITKAKNKIKKIFQLLESNLYFAYLDENIILLINLISSNRLIETYYMMEKSNFTKILYFTELEDQKKELKLLFKKAEKYKLKDHIKIEYLTSKETKIAKKLETIHSFGLEDNTIPRVFLGKEKI